jgi:glycosyltransferase involved in cell wall biosynthesis
MRFVWQIDRWLAGHRKEYDVVMVSMLKHAAWTATRSSNRLGFPVYLKSWGAGTSGDMAWQRTGRLGLRIRAGTKEVDGVFAPSLAVELELREAGYERIIRVPNGAPRMDPPWNPAETSAWRRKLGWPDRPTILTTGRLSWEKGLLDAVSAVPTVLRMVPEAQLVMVGEGPQREELAERARSLGVADRVRMPGAVSDVEPVLRGGDLYLLPSHFEGLSVALLEALCLGMPAAVSNTPANLGILPESLLPLFPVGHPESQGKIVGEILASRRLNTELGTIRRRACDEYGIEGVALRHVEEFQKGIDGRSNGPA